MYLCSKSFLMCHWRQWLPSNFDWKSLKLLCNIISHRCVFTSQDECGNAGFSVAPSWRLSISEDLSVQDDTEASLCLIKASVPLVCSLPVYVSFLHQARTPSGLRETLAFELLFRHFLLIWKQREENTDPYLLLPKRSVHPSIHPWEWVSAHTVQRSWLQSGSKSGFVSKATRLLRHFISVLWTVLQSKSPTDSSVSSLQNYSCILNTGPLEFKKKSFHNTVDSEMSLLKKSQYIIWNVLQKKKKMGKKGAGCCCNCNIYHINMYRFHAAG